MGTNVGGADRVARVVVGLALFSLLFVLKGNARWWGLFGVVPLALQLSVLYLYRLVGVRTCSLAKK